MKKCLLFVFLISLMSCSDLSDLNNDPSALTEIHPRFIVPAIQTQVAFHLGTNASRMSGIFTHYLKGADVCAPAFTFTMGGDQMNYYWTSQYVAVIGNCDALLGLLDGEQNFYKAQAYLFKANAFNQLSLYFGDIPFSEVGDDLKLRPKYDDQKLVLEGVIDLLDEAIVIFSNPDNSYEGGDLIYDGDWDLWLKAAYGLKARYLLQREKLSNTDYQEVIDLVEASFTSSDENCSFQFIDSSTGNWSLAKFAIERPGTLLMEDHFINILDSDQDPRKEKYCVEKSTEWNFYDENNTELVWGRNDALIPILSFVELKFIQAECLAKLNLQTQDAFLEAVDQSLSMLGVDDTNTENYISSLPDLNSLDKDAQLKEIIEQAHRAYFGFNFDQSYHNYRRTGFPELPQVTINQTATNPSGIIPVRYFYVESEFQTNSTNLQMAMSNQNGATLDIDLKVFR